MNKDKIKFNDLSWPIKTIVITGWFSIGYTVLMFIVGFLVGLVSTV